MAVLAVPQKTMFCEFLLAFETRIIFKNVGAWRRVITINGVYGFIELNDVIPQASLIPKYVPENCSVRGWLPGFISCLESCLDCKANATIAGSNIVKSLTGVNSDFRTPGRRIQISSRNPDKVHASLIKQGVNSKSLLPSVPVDVTKPDTLVTAFEGADVIVSLVGIMHGTCARLVFWWRNMSTVSCNRDAP